MQESRFQVSEEVTPTSATRLDFKQNSGVKFSYSGPGELSDKVHQNHKMIEQFVHQEEEFLTAK